MELGLGVLGLSPAVFWALTPRELDCILRGRSGRAFTPEAPGRHDLQILMNLFPDE